MTYKVLQLISPSGFYGAERWVVAFLNSYNQEQLSTSLGIITDAGSDHSGIISSLKDPNTQVHYLTSKGRVDFSLVTKLNKVIRDQSIDIIHSHGYKSDSIALISARLTGIKCVSTPHGYGSALDWRIRQYFKFGRFVLRFFDCVVPLSRDLHVQLLKSGISPYKLTVINNAVDLDAIERIGVGTKSPCSSNINDTALTIGFIGRLIPSKQIDQIIHVFCKLCEYYKNIRLVIGGEGPLKQSLMDQATTLGVLSSINFLGYVENGIEETSKMDIFVMTSESEGIPRCIMEALALRVPVVAYDIPGVSELIVNRETGLLVPLNDIDGFIASCAELIDNKKLRDELANAGRKHVEENFTSSQMTSEYALLFDNLLNDNDHC